MILYGIKNCNTVKSAVDWLKKNDLEFEFHDYKKAGITTAKLNEWSKQVGWESLVNHVVPYEELEMETLKWAREMLQHSPLAIRCLKAALNADCDGQMGLLDLAGNATLLYYMSEEAKEGKNAFVERRAPDFNKFPRLP